MICGLRRVACHFWIASFGLTFLILAVGRADVPPSEYEAKADYVYHFAKFVEWPNSAFAQADSPIVIGIIGKDPFGKTIDRRVKGEKVNGRPFEVRRFVKWGPAVKQCHILFVGASEKGKIRQMVELLQDAPVLTVGETPGFARRGGVINFIFKDEKLYLQINVKNAKRVGLTISPGLLNVAEIIES